MGTARCAQAVGEGEEAVGVQQQLALCKLVSQGSLIGAGLGLLRPYLPGDHHTMVHVTVQGQFHQQTSDSNKLSDLHQLWLCNAGVRCFDATCNLFKNVIKIVTMRNETAVGNSAKVNPDLTRKTVQGGSSVLMHCTFSAEFDYSNVTAYWWKEDNKTVLQEDSKKLFRVIRGEASLKLLNVTVRDAGTYHCAVAYQKQKLGQAAVQLIVYALPAPLKIVSVPSEDLFSASLRLQCRTSDFYPKDFNLTWFKNGTKILTGFRNEQLAKPEGLYEVVSTLELREAVESGTAYTCQVYHVSSSFPANASYTVINKDFASNISVTVAAGCAAGAFAILILVPMMAKGFLFFTSKGRETKNSRNPTQQEDGRKEEMPDDKLTYAALNLVGSEDGIMLKQQEEITVYAETKHSMADGRLTYLALKSNDSSTSSKSKNQEKSPVYAAVKSRN
ncbi:tyrosine-protein phosphatase non-receptor type substrate 1-like [Stegostoma tigrinum]|uniref:tyrosine-protein phosphatase non-receptor type substrate 1-like n=1 Tax=Stegostoma tigrinum TaxID=3053191 RepID=UPI00287015AE|nr:tyrosine-protein phosphatase non-receptor type substrate 1-like [Stegostoma tigrinum]